MKRNTRALVVYIGIHVAIPLICLTAMLITQFVQKTPASLFSGCWFHDVLFLYCPLCGGTRAAGALARFDFWEAFQYNAAVVIFLIAFLIGDLIVFVRLVRKKEKWWSVPRWCWFAAIGLFVGYTVLRNLLMVLWEIDPTGDLVSFWQ